MPGAGFRALTGIRVTDDFTGNSTPTLAASEFANLTIVDIVVAVTAAPDFHQSDY